MSKQRRSILSILAAVAFAIALCPGVVYADEAFRDNLAAATGVLTVQDDLIASGTWGTCPWEINADGVLTVQSAQNSEIAASGTCGSCVWTLDNSGNFVIKPAEGDTGILSNWWDDHTGYLGVAPPWIQYRSDIKTARFEGRIKALTCMHMFDWCTNMTSVNLSGLDTTDVENMGGMFDGCGSLTSIDVSPLDTSKATSMSCMFRSCDSLNQLDLSGFDFSNVNEIASMFEDCCSLQSLDVSFFNTSKVTSMFGVFRGCNQLPTIDVSNWDTSNVTDMSYMFDGCYALTALDVSGFNTSRVKNMTDMFWCCTKLTELDVSGFDTSNVEHMYGMFDGCSSLTSLDVSGFDTSHLEGDTSNTANHKNGGADMFWMFRGCRSLTSLDVSGFDVSNVVDMTGMFSGCSSLTSLDVSGFNTSNAMLMNSMFEGCISLTSLDVSGFDTSNVVNMNSMFWGCRSLTSLNVSGFDIANVEDLNEIFAGCSALITLDLSRWVNTSLSTIDLGDCNALSCISVGEETGSFKLPWTYWYSQLEGKSYTSYSISESRKGIADTYTTSATSNNIANATILGYPMQYVSYQGTPITSPNLKVKLGGKELIEGTDYTVSYSDNDKLGRATITVTGINVYLGSKQVHFTIVNPGDPRCSNVRWTPVTFGVTFPADGDSWTPMRIKWGFDLFDMSPLGSAFSTGYDNRLAIASAVLSEAAYSEDLAYRVFGELGIRDAFRAEKYSNQIMNQPATCMGYTQASIGGVTKNLYVIAIRGTNSAADLGTDAGAWMQAFEPSAEYVRNRFNAFVSSVEQEYPSSSSLENVVLVTGHSLGGAVAGRLTEFLAGDSRFQPANTFCYTFAAPNWTYSHTNQYYKNIKNIVNGDDIVPKQNFSAAYRNGIDIKFYPMQTPGFQTKFAVVTKGRNYENMASWDVLSTGGNLKDAVLMVKHQMDSYMSYLLCEYGAEELWQYEIGCVRRISVRCPVDVELADEDGNVVAKVVNNEITKTSLRVETVVEGDEKYFYLLDDEDYAVNLVGTAQGLMSLSMEDINIETGEVESAKNYTNVVLEQDKLFVGSVTQDSDVSDANLTVLGADGNPIAEVQEDGTEVLLQSGLEPDPVNLSGATVSLSQTSYTYDGKAKEPTVTVKLDDTVLERDVDYIVVYKDNTNVGTAMVTVAGKGNYVGSKSATFSIVAAGPGDGSSGESAYPGKSDDFGKSGASEPADEPKTELKAYGGKAKAAGFTDLDANAWYMNAGGTFPESKTLYLDYTIAKGLMSGYSGTTRFAPDDDVSRAMVATIIYRSATGATEKTTDNDVSTKFSDVPAGRWYSAAVAWCANHEVVTGYSGTGRFGPDDPVTREQLATMVGRYCQKVHGMPSAGEDVSRFKDAASISAFARAGVAFCAANAIVSGIGDTGNFDPQGLANRAQMAKIIAVTAYMLE